MGSVKQEVAELLRKLSEDVTLEDIQYQLYIMAKSRKGRDDIAQGKAYLSDEARQRLDRWLES